MPNQTLEHARYFGSLLDHLMRLCLLDESCFSANVKLRSKLAAGTFGDLEKAREFLRRIAFISFRDIRPNRERRARYLIFKSEVLATAQSAVKLVTRPAAALPVIQVLKRLHSAFFYLPLETCYLQLGFNASNFAAVNARCAIRISCARPRARRG